MSTAWTDGTIIRFQSRLAPVELAAIMQETLAMFDAWAIIDLAGESVDNVGAAGPISQFFEQRRVKTFSQIYIIAKNKDAKYEMAADGIKTKLAANSQPAFHFRDGKIILVSTNEPASITASRCRYYLDKMLYLAIIDHSGMALSRDVDDDWVDIYLDSLSYRPRI
ncbi:MAG: hypothetical protein ACREDD_07580 [Methylocella sp.]